MLNSRPEKWHDKMFEGACLEYRNIATEDNDIASQGKAKAYRQSGTETSLLFDQRAHLTLSVHRSARREAASFTEAGRHVWEVVRKKALWPVFGLES